MLDPYSFDDPSLNTLFECNLGPHVFSECHAYYTSVFPPQYVTRCHMDFALTEGQSSIHPIPPSADYHLQALAQEQYEPSVIKTWYEERLRRYQQAQSQYYSTLSQENDLPSGQRLRSLPHGQHSGQPGIAGLLPTILPNHVTVTYGPTQSTNAAPNAVELLHLKKRYSCPVCRRSSFARAKDLKRHVNQICGQSKIWRCPVMDCEREFIRQDRFKQHHKVGHGCCQQNENRDCSHADSAIRCLPPPRVQYCGFCSETFDNDQQSYLRHVVKHFDDEGLVDNWNTASQTLRTPQTPSVPTPSQPTHSTETPTSAFHTDSGPGKNRFTDRATFLHYVHPHYHERQRGQLASPSHQQIWVPHPMNLATTSATQNPAAVGIRSGPEWASSNASRPHAVQQTAVSNEPDWTDRFAVPVPDGKVYAELGLGTHEYSFDAPVAAHGESSHDQAGNARDDRSSDVQTFPQADDATALLSYIADDAVAGRSGASSLHDFAGVLPAAYLGDPPYFPTAPLSPPNK